MTDRLIANEPAPSDLDDPAYLAALERSYEAGTDEVGNALTSHVAHVAHVADPAGDNSTVAHVADVALPWGENGDTDLAGILDQLDTLLARYVAFPTIEARHAVAAWIVHTWCVDAFESTPRLALLSPEKGSGKTRTLEVLELVVPSPLHTVNVSAAALFRKVAGGPCTLLLDEADTYLGWRVAAQHEELRGLINAGHRRGAVAYRCVLEKGVKVEEFPAFAPVALAGIGDLPDTIIDRSVVVAMKRRRPDEPVLPFRRRKAERETADLRDWLESWSDRNVERIEDYEPTMPAGIVDRPADVWEPLVSIGDHAGTVWSTRLRAAATNLNAQRADRDPSLGVQLLADVRRIFTTEGTDRLPTDRLLELLVAIDEAPWGDLRGQPLDARGLARRLRPYGAKPADHRFGDEIRKGYTLTDLHDAFARYLPVAHVAFEGGEVGQALGQHDPRSSPEEAQQGQQAQQTGPTCSICGHPCDPVIGDHPGCIATTTTTTEETTP